MVRGLKAAGWLIAGVLAAGTQAWAAEESGAVSATEAKTVTKELLRGETFSLKPQAGVIDFLDSAGNRTARAAAGITADMNVMTLSQSTLTPWYAGPTIGLIYSHLGDPSSNFWGSSASTNAGQAGANILILPTDVKLGYAFTDYYRISVHGGGNVVFRSVASSMDLGSGSESQGSLWRYYPNLGGDLDVSLGKSVAIVLRPDWTFTSGNDFFTGTVGIGIFLG